MGSIARAGDRPLAIVTGATSGIGRWIALGMARAGHHVIVIGRDRARGIATQTWIDRQVHQASTELVIADLSLLSETRNAGKSIANRYSRISVLINNAGVFESRQVATADACSFDRLHTVGIAYRWRHRATIRGANILCCGPS